MTGGRWTLRSRTRGRASIPLACALCLAALASGCRKSRCEDLTPVPIAGVYAGGGSLGEERMLRVSLLASGTQVALTYTTMDGSQIRAIYRAIKKGRKK